MAFSQGVFESPIAPYLQELDNFADYAVMQLPGHNRGLEMLALYQSALAYINAYLSQYPARVERDLYLPQTSRQAQDAYENLFEEIIGKSHWRDGLDLDEHRFAVFLHLKEKLFTCVASQSASYLATIISNVIYKKGPVEPEHLVLAREILSNPALQAPLIKALTAFQREVPAFARQPADQWQTTVEDDELYAARVEGLIKTALEVPKPKPVIDRGAQRQLIFAAAMKRQEEQRKRQEEEKAEKERAEKERVSASHKQEEGSSRHTAAVQSLPVIDSPKPGKKMPWWKYALAGIGLASGSVALASAWTALMVAGAVLVFCSTLYFSYTAYQGCRKPSKEEPALVEACQDEPHSPSLSKPSQRSRKQSASYSQGKAAPLLPPSVAEVSLFKAVEAGDDLAASSVAKPSKRCCF